MMADRHCWWCGFAAEVDTENPEPHNGLVRDTETSWICTDNDGCNQRALAGRFAERTAVIPDRQAGNWTTGPSDGPGDPVQ